MTQKKDRKGTFQPIEGYEILERLGSGGMGTVFKASQLSMNRIVALKILKKSDLKDSLSLERLRREALVTARMDHPHIVKGIDFGETPRYYYYAMEYVKGRSVKTILDQEGAIPEKKALSIVRDLALALDHAFGCGVVHRDIKPGNIIVTPNGRAKLTDLGLAKGIIDLTVTKEGTTVGTPQYISPDQARDPSEAGIRSDIYSLGATYYHMVTGRVPFEGESVAEVITNVLYGQPKPPETVCDSVSAATSRCISRMMAKDQKRRYQTPSELKGDLDLLSEALGEGTHKAALTLGMSWSDSQKRPDRKVLWMIAAACLGVLLVLFAYTVLPDDRDREETDRAVPELRTLKEEFGAGGIEAAEALARLEAMSADLEKKQRLEAGAFRRELLNHCRKTVDAIVSADSERTGESLIAVQFDTGSALLERKFRNEAARNLGCGPDDFPPEIETLLQDRLRELVQALELRVDEAREKVRNGCAAFVETETKLVAAALEENDFTSAHKRIAALEENWVLAARRALKKSFCESFPRCAAGRTDAELEPLLDRSIDSERERLRKTIVTDLESRLRGSIASAVSAYEEKLAQTAEGIVEEADYSTLTGGPETILAAAVEELEDLEPRIPERCGAEPPDLRSLAAALAPLVDKRRLDLTALEKTRVLLEIEGYMRLGEVGESLRTLERESSAREQFPDRAFLERWIKWINTLARVDDRAMEALKRHVRLEVVLARKGVTYRGELESVDETTRILRLKGPSGRILTIPFGDLDALEVFRWAEKSYRFAPVETFLFLYYAGRLEEAEHLIVDLDGFEERAFFLDRIGDFKRFTRDEQKRADQEMTRLLEAGLNALEAGDRTTLAALVDRLKDEEESLSAGEVWKRRHRDREKMVKGLKDLAAADGFRSRLEKNFSVPVEMIGEGRIRVYYDFESPFQIDDFRVRSLGLTVENGRLLYGCGEEKISLPPFDESVGFRFAEGFSTRSPLKVSFSYRAHIGGGGPNLFVVSFFGECFGIRSFPDDRHAGQTSAWTGDLNDWEDHFFYPDLGMLEARKGRPLAFGLNRGELYTIGLEWDGQELLLIVDDSTVLRRTPSSLKGRWCEVKTLRTAVYDDLVIEGEYRGK